MLTLSDNSLNLEHRAG